MADTPTRYKDRADFDPDETLQAVRAARAGKPAPRIETDEYKQYRRDALAEAGLTEESEEADPGEPVPLEEMTTAEHVDRLQRGRR